MIFRKILLIISLVATVFSQNAFQGYTIFSPAAGGPGGQGNGNTYLVNNQMNVINVWNHNRGPASMAYLRTDSTIYYPFRVENPTMSAGGVGGGVAILDWDSNVLWSYIISNNQYQHHHDIYPLPNGNVLVIAWERKTATEAYALGRQTITNPLNEMWSEAVLELEPVGTNNANIVWEWHLWDHLIQDSDSTLPNYGVIADHPELMDINAGSVGGSHGPGGSHADWMHFNAIDYNEELDQIVLSSRTMGEIYIIDHSTTTAEAASDSGGTYGKGGNFLYRWGNPEVYDRGTGADQLLNAQHGVNWIPSNYPGGGNLILYNNNYQNNNSAVFELVTPIDSTGNYTLIENEAYGPSGPVWYHTGGFHSNVQSGAFRLPNGNTLITEADDAHMFEVTPDHSLVWNYTYPGNNIMIARAQKYELTYLETEFPEYTPGDVNFDGDINVIDLSHAIDMIYNVGYNATPPADVNGDGTVNMVDVAILAQMAMNQ